MTEIYDLHPRTRATLQQLADADWFSAVGVKDTEAAIVLPSWNEAIAHCSSVEWENLCLEAANQLRMRILERDRARYAEWNEVVDKLKPVIIPFVQEMIRDVVARHQLPPSFEDTVQWDILHLCLESEYADVFPPAFYASHAYWYVKGHFPCGWQGTFPDGKLIIY